VTQTNCLMKCRLHGIKLILPEEAKSCGLCSVVTVSEPDGVSKITLAQQIHSDKKTSSEFEMKMWVLL
jgi:hypothetical protein